MTHSLRTWDAVVYSPSLYLGSASGSMCALLLPEEQKAVLFSSADDRFGVICLEDGGFLVVGYTC